MSLFAFKYKSLNSKYKKNNITVKKKIAYLYLDLMLKYSFKTHPRIWQFYF